MRMENEVCCKMERREGNCIVSRTSIYTGLINTLVNYIWERFRSMVLIKVKSHAHRLNILYYIYIYIYIL